MKRKTLLALALAGVLILCNVPMTVSAASPNAGGAIVGDQQADVGDTLDIGEEDTPLTAPEDGTPEEAPEQTPEENAPEETPVETPEDVTVEDDETPLAVLSSDAQTKSGFSWWGFAVGVLTTGVVGTGVWAVLKSKKKGK